MTIPKGFTPYTKVSVIDDTGRLIDIGDLLSNLEWSSFMNGGYKIRAELNDSFYEKLGTFATRFYLRASRKIPIPIRFKIGWTRESGDRDLSTPEFTAYMTELGASGENNSGTLSFGAVDPATYVLSQGTAGGGAYVGNISDVIKQVVNSASARVLSKAPIDPTTGKRPRIEVEVSATHDSKSNIWHQMRMDPQTFIKSLLEFSSSLTKHRSEWIIASGNKFITAQNGQEISIPAIFIKQWPDLMNSFSESERNLGPVVVNTNTPGGNDVLEMEFDGNNFIGVIQSQLVTQGISSTSGLYIDKSDREAIVNDNTTPNKLNADGLDDKMAFTAPGNLEGNDKATSIMAIPELSGGVIGRNYKNWIDGRARNTFLNMLNALMRIKVRVSGWHEIGDSTKLGVSTVNLSWKNNSGDNYFLGGNWIIYGFRHYMSTEEWYTDLYLARIDWDANAIGLPSGRRISR